MRRRFGRRATSAVAVAAVVVTGIAPVALAWDDAPQTAAVEAPQTAGTIGIVDTDVPINRVNPGHPAAHDLIAEATANHGATLVQPGATGQSIADIRFTLPNRFKSGDNIDLVLLDRSATEWEDRYTNKDAAHLVGFSAAPSVAVSGAKAAGTEVARDTESTVATNTETAPDTPWLANTAAPAGSISRVAPSVAPKFNVSLGKSAGDQGNNQIRLTVDGVSSLGDPSAVWVVTLSDLKVNLGANVTPGELRVVPFATNVPDTTGAPYVPSPWFHGNMKAWDHGTSVTTDDTPREIGIYTVPAWVAPAKVTGGTSLVSDGVTQNVGTITITENATFAIGNGTYCLKNAGFVNNSVSYAGATVTISGGGVNEVVSPIGSNGCFTLTDMDPQRISTITISGVTGAADVSGRLAWWLEGGTITDSGGASWFHSPAGSSTLEINVAAGSGQDIWGDCNFAWQTSLTVARTCTLDPRQACETGVAGAVTSQTSTGTAAGPVAYVGAPVTVTPVAAGDILPAGTYRVLDGDTIQGPGTMTMSLVSGTLASGVWRDTTGNEFTITNLQVGMAFTVGAANAVTGATVTGPLPTVSTSDTTSPFIAAPTGTYSVVQTAPGVYTVTLPGGGTIANVQNGVAVAYNGAEWTFTNLPAIAATVPATTFTFNVPTVTTTPVNAAGTGNNDRTGFPCGVNQKDIVAPALALYTQANAPAARIGGANRYSTAAKIAAAWTLSVPGSGTDFHNVNFGGGRARNVILASGENFPDALSASYMSSRVKAPILLTGKNWLPKETVEALRDRFVEKVYIVGGEAAISDSVEAQVKDLAQYVPENITNPLTTLQWINWQSGTFQSLVTLLTYQTPIGSVDAPIPGIWFNAPKPSGAKLQVERLGGSTRYTTNQVVNMYAAAWGGNSTIGRTVANYGEASKYTGILARGDNFPDALTGGILTAGVNGAGHDAALPLILTDPNSLSQSARAQFDNMDVEHLLVIGSETAIASGVETAVKALGISTRRLGGVDRYATAGEVAKYALTDAIGRPATDPIPNLTPGLGFNNGQTSATDGRPWARTGEIAWLATGLKYPDALTAAPFVGSIEDVIALVWRDSIPGNTKTWLSSEAKILDRAVGLGMGEVVSTKVINEANALVGAL